MAERLKLSAVIAATPERIYDAWLDGKEHGAFTGAKATASKKVSGRFTAWDGYIEGRNLELESGRRIVQAWRSSEFPAGAPDSRLEVLFAKSAGGTKVTVVHTNIPDGQGANYKRGWGDHYFAPMKAYFATAAKKPPAKKPAATEVNAKKGTAKKKR